MIHEEADYASLLNSLIVRVKIVSLGVAFF